MPDEDAVSEEGTMPEESPLAAYDHETSSEGATQYEHHAPVEDEEGTPVKPGGKTPPSPLTPMQVISQWSMT